MEDEYFEQKISFKTLFSKINIKIHSYKVDKSKELLYIIGNDLEKMNSIYNLIFDYISFDEQKEFNEKYFGIEKKVLNVIGKDEFNALDLC